MTKTEMQARWRAERYEAELRIIRIELREHTHAAPCGCSICFVVRRINELFEE